MRCDIYLKIGDESILIAEGMDSSLIPSEINDDFLNIVKNSGQIDLLKSKLEKVLLDGVTEVQIEGIDKKELRDYQIANTTAKEISLTCPGIHFPDIDLSKIKVRLVDKFKSYGTNIIIKTSPNGEPIYILDGNFSTIKKFARHLAIEDAINNQILDKLDKDSTELKTIDKILEKAKIKYPKYVKDRHSLLRHYIKNKDKYNKISITEGNETYTASVLLDNILPLIENIYYPKNNNYSSPLIKNLHGPGGITYSDGKPQILYNDLYNILSTSLNLSMFKSLKEFNELLNSSKKLKELEKYEELLSRELSVDRDRQIQELLDSDEHYKTLSKFFALFNLDILEEGLYDENNYNILFTQIFSEERGYPYSYLNTSKNGIIRFKSNYYSLEANYGLSYDTILSLPKPKYKGWNILIHELDNGNKEYFISLYRMLSSTKGKPYSSLKEAKAAIDLRISEQTFKGSFLILLHLEFNKMNTNGIINISSKTNPILKGNIIRIPRISLPNKIEILDPRENIILGESTLEDFKDVIRIWSPKVQEILFDENGNLIKDINTVSKAGIFLALLNNKYKNLERTPEIINDILEQLRNANKNPVYFYVESSTIIKRKKKNKVTGEVLTDKDGKILYSEVKLLKLVKIPNPDTISDTDMSKKGFQYPVISFWEDAALTLNNIFGTKINILTQSEILDLFGEKYSGEKAFIIGDNVYVNSTIGSTEDLFHEYIHIIMGYLKVNNPEVYSNLLTKVWDLTEGTDRRKINMNYTGDSYISRLEENFAKRFSEYIYNRGKTKLDEIFNSSELVEAFDTIFDKSDFNLKELGNHPLSEIFSRFSSEISMALLKNDKMFGTFASSEKFRLNNKKTNLLQKWIKEGKIKEFNCR